MLFNDALSAAVVTWRRMRWTMNRLRFSRR